MDHRTAFLEAVDGIRQHAVASTLGVDAKRVLLMARVRQRRFEFGDDRGDALVSPIVCRVDDFLEVLGREQPTHLSGQVRAERKLAAAWLCADEEPVQARDRHALAGAKRHRMRDHRDPFGCSRRRCTPSGSLHTHCVVAEQRDRVGYGERRLGVCPIVPELPTVGVNAEAKRRLRLLRNCYLNRCGQLGGRTPTTGGAQQRYNQQDAAAWQPGPGRPTVRTTYQSPRLHDYHFTERASYALHIVFGLTTA